MMLSSPTWIRLGEVRQFVDTEDAAVAARDQAVMDGQLVGQVAPLGDLDRVHLADQIGDRDVGGGQFLAVALLPPDPAEERAIALLGEHFLALAGDRRERVLRDLRGLQDRDLVVEQHQQRSNEPRLGLAALAQEDDVLPGPRGRFPARGRRCRRSPGCPETSVPCGAAWRSGSCASRRAPAARCSHSSAVRRPCVVCLPWPGIPPAPPAPRESSGVIRAVPRLRRARQHPRHLISCETRQGADLPPRIEYSGFPHSPQPADLAHPRRRLHGGGRRSRPRRRRHPP